MSGTVIKLSVALKERTLRNIIENIDGSPAIFIVLGKNATKFSSQVMLYTILINDRLFISSFSSKTDFQEACPPALPVLVGGDELIIRVPGLDDRREHTI